MNTAPATTKTQAQQPALRVPKIGAKGSYHPTSNPVESTVVTVVDRAPLTVSIRPLRSEKAIELPATEAAMATLEFDADAWEDWAAYPEHDKQRAISATSQAIYDFLMSAAEEGHQLMRVTRDHICPMDPDDSEPVYTETSGKELEQLLAAQFGIDLKRIAVEKEQMYEAMRAMSTSGA